MDRLLDRYEPTEIDRLSNIHTLYLVCILFETSNKPNETQNKFLNGVKCVGIWSFSCHRFGDLLYIKCLLH